MSSPAAAVIIILFCCCCRAADVPAAPVTGPGSDGTTAVTVGRDVPPRRCPDDGACPLGMECAKTEQDSGEVNTTEVVYRCVCKEKDLTCGSDNRTYLNACQLNESAAKLGVTLWVQYWGPCLSAPIIKSAPKNLAGFIGNPVVFDCEIMGYPVPSISWQFTDTFGISKWLPGDDTLIVIQTRGGPDHLTVTSWVQIMTFKHSHTGNYTCIGTNSVDTTMVSAALDIRKMT